MSYLFVLFGHPALTPSSLALLGPGLYRPLLALKLTDSSDVRNSPLPIYDRIATLLKQQRDDDKPVRYLPLPM